MTEDLQTRINAAFTHICNVVTYCGPELYPVYADSEVRGDTLFITNFVFLDGKGKNFLEAVEDDLKKRGEGWWRDYL